MSLPVYADSEATALSDDSAIESNPAQYSMVAQVNYKAIETDADKYFYAGLQTDDKSLKEAYLSQALAKYMLLLSINPKDYVVCTQIGIIHDKLGRYNLSKDYFTRAINLAPMNPYPSFHFGEYYYGRKNYDEALVYYKTAYDTGYDKSFELNLQLGILYEKLGDIQNARKYYIAARKLNTRTPELAEKIKSLNSVYYSRSDYKK